MDTKEKKEFNLQFWRFLWSSILIALSACLGSVVDSMLVGRMINEDSVSAINLSFPFLQFMFTINMLLATGAGMLVGMQLGKKDTQYASSIFTVSMMACLVASLVFSACGFFFPDASTRLLCSSEEIFEPTRSYLQIMMITAPVYMMMWGLDTMVSVDGSPRLVSISILIDNAVHIVLDIVFIRYIGWGIEGSAWAAVIGHVVGIAMMSFHFLSAKNNLRLTFRSDIKNMFSTLKELVSQGAPLAIASICLTLMLLSSNHIIMSSLGRMGIFAFSLCMNLLLIYNLFLTGVCRTIQSLGAIQVGKGDNEGFTLVLRKSFYFITVAMLITSIAVWIWPEVIVMLFGADEPDLIAQACHALRIFSLNCIFFCYIYAIMIVYKLCNYHKIALFISLALSLTVIPVLWLFSMYAKEWIWFGFLTAYLIEMVAIFVLHKMTHVKFELSANK